MNEPQPISTPPEDAQPVAAKTTTAPTPAPVARPKESPKHQPLLPFFFLNLLAVYLPGLLPAIMQAMGRDDGAGFDFQELRVLLIDFLDAPYRWLGLEIHVPVMEWQLLGFRGGVFMLTPWLGEIGSFYTMLFGLWFVVLGISIAARTMLGDIG
ncbi:MAG: hypothetical protein QM775_07565 [Pirellulales bacterium]